MGRGRGGFTKNAGRSKNHFLAPDGAVEVRRLLPEGKAIYGARLHRAPRAAFFHSLMCAPVFEHCVFDDPSLRLPED